jgi:formamidopyrimidine-DNA glycosylase
MPELPEVETVKRGLSRLIVGKTIASVESDWQKSFPNSDDDIAVFMIKATIVNIARRAKVLLIELDTKYSLVIHLKMTGQIVYRGQTEDFGAGHPNESLVGKLPDRSTRVSIRFSDDSWLYFNDQRKFGWMRLIPTVEVMNLDFFKKVGPEPLAQEFNWLKFKERLLRRPNSAIKAVLLDQTIVAGIGNIYADESLWGSAIHPATLVRQLSDSQIRLLYEELVFVLELSIEKGGSTDKNYVNAEGRRGSYLTFARVFRKEGQPCPRCDTIIIKTRLAGRGTHLCPNCQKVRTIPTSPPKKSS